MRIVPKATYSINEQVILRLYPITSYSYRPQLRTKFCFISHFIIADNNIVGNANKPTPLATLFTGMFTLFKIRLMITQVGVRFLYFYEVCKRVLI